MRKPIEDRFWNRVRRSSEDECWVWTGATTGGHPPDLRYGSMGAYRADGSRSSILVHRLAYELQVGPIPAGMTIDHLCRNPLCVNPRHLEAVTMAENLRRGNGFSALNSRKTHCPKGHPYDEANTRLYKGYRYCRACRKV